MISHFSPSPNIVLNVVRVERVVRYCIPGEIRRFEYSGSFIRVICVLLEISILFRIQRKQSVPNLYMQSVEHAIRYLALLEETREDYMD